MIPSTGSNVSRWLHRQQQDPFQPTSGEWPVKSGHDVICARAIGRIFKRDRMTDRLESTCLYPPDDPATNDEGLR
jgi:hypothetical protein